MFVELHAQSAFSFLEAAEQPETLAEEAARLEMPALALVDRDGVYGAPRFYRAMTKHGLRALVGSEITLADGSRLPLLVEDREGYQNLCRLITKIKLRETDEIGRQARAGDSPGARALMPARASIPDIEEHASGLVCLTGTAEAHLDRLLGIFGRSGCFVEVQRHLDRDEERRAQRLLALADHYRVPVVAANQPVFCRPDGRAVADVLTCIREHTDLDHAGRRLARNAERSLKGARAMERLFADRPDAIANTGELATRLTFTLKNLGYRFPDYPLPPGETPISYLRGLTERGARDRYGRGPLAARARAQIARELDLIGRLDLAGYFLIVWEIVQYCRAHGILVQGRGSAANSAVCYSLGITAVDPVKMDLLFERFLSEARGEWPDIDLDLPSGERREQVIQHVYRRYGPHGAGMTANVITYRGRLAAREVGKALGLPPEVRDRLSRLVPNWGYRDPEDVLVKHLDEAGCDSRHPRLRTFAALWCLIQDLPRHLGQHSGGMVIAGGRLDEVVPLEPATMPGRVVIQWDKDDCAALGIVKVDLLGLGMMAVLQDAITLVREQGGEFDLARLPPDDRDVYAALQQADTIGVFQVESRAQMATLPRIHPERFYDLVVQVAIIRPGPIVGDMVHPYINRRRGREPVTYPHPSLEPILRRTLGVPLFQEQLLRMAMVAAGFTGSEAEELRRAFGFKRSETRMQEIEGKLRAGMAGQGITGAAAEQIVHAITAFALYGFPECVTGDTRVIDADTGRWVRIEDVVAGRARVEHTLACDANLKLRKRRVLAATTSGCRPVYRVRTALGHEITATAEHPLLTMSGWRPLAGLRPGDHIAAARALPAFGHKRWPRHRLIVLADLIAEGNLCHPSTFYFYTTDPQHRDEFVNAVQQFDNTKATVARHRNCYSVHVRRRDSSRRNGAVEWVRQLEIWGSDSHSKHVPDEVFELHTADITFLLARLWEGDGSLSGVGHASYDTVSRRLAEDVQHLLLRVGVVARIYTRVRPYRDRHVTGFVVTITGQENLRRFYRRIASRFLDKEKRRKARALAESRTDGRPSRDIIPVEVKALIDRARKQRGGTWDEVEYGARLSMRAVVSPDGSKRGYRRWVIDRLGRYFGSHELMRLAASDLYWDRITSVEPFGVRETYDLHIEGDYNFLANDLVVHNSHAASFALLAYASAYLKVHQPAAFFTAILNNQPMGFYHPATLVKDAQRHGTRILPVDVTVSDWLCTIETPEGSGKPAVRLGLRYVRGLRESAGRAIVAERAKRAFRDVDDLVRRSSLGRDEVETLAEIGALAAFGLTRRAALWTGARASRPAGALFEKGPDASDPSPLREMTREERLVADYAGTAVTIGPHPMVFRRPELTRLGVLRAIDLSGVPHGRRVQVAGSVIVRQRPGTAKGFVFLSLEDETGIANVIVRPWLFARCRLTLVSEPFLLIDGTLQQQDGVVSVRAERVDPLPPLAHNVPSHDFG